jgi:hypothetical protein
LHERGTHLNVHAYKGVGCGGHTGEWLYDYGEVVCVCGHRRLDNEDADQVRPDIPTIEYVFLNVALGQHTVEVHDVVGHHETAEVVVTTSNIVSDNPAWLNDLIERLESEPVANPSAFMTQYEYVGQTVYFLPQRCCDIFSVLYDAEGNVLGHPHGGITSQGDGRVPDFFQVRSSESVL